MTINIERASTVGEDNGRLIADKYNNSRIRQLDYIGAPKPWVVDNSMGDEFWDKVKGFAIPLKIKRGILPVHRKERKKFEAAKRRYGDDIFMVLIPDDECFEGWAARPVIPSDLQKTHQQLLDESLEAINDGDFLLADMKRHTAMIVTGWTDTK